MPEGSVATFTICAWAGCTRHHTFGDQPNGWRYLVTYQSRAPKIVLDFTDPTFRPTRDAALCPHHAAELESKLKEIRRV